MGPQTRELYGQERSTTGLLVWLAIFAVAFGYIEGAVAHYLRLHLYPGGFDDAVSLVVDRHTLAVEAGREICTLVLLAAVAALTRGPGLRRLASFVYIFAIWDLCYYAALRLFEGWPASLGDWDLLFLVPVPWFAPVLAPIAISAIGVVGAVSVHLLIDSRGRLALPWQGVALVNGALAAWEISFMAHGGPRTTFPDHYEWKLFSLGVALALAGYLVIWRANAPSPAARGA